MRFKDAIEKGLKEQRDARHEADAREKRAANIKGGKIRRRLIVPPIPKQDVPE